MNNMLDMTTDLNNYLAPNERILWQGQGQRKFFSATNPGILFALIFGGVAAVMLVVFLTIGSSTRSSSSVPSFFVVFIPLLFIVIGLGVGIPISAMSRGANARYVLTSAAAIIVNDSRWTGKRTTIIPLKNIAQLSLTENRDGSGTITFGSNPFAAYGRYGTSMVASATPAFWNIEKPLEVYQLIRKQMTDQ
jgi:hypothetical protein